jgi:hypothetical protein
MNVPAPRLRNARRTIAGQRPQIFITYTAMFNSRRVFPCLFHRAKAMDS